MSLCDLEFGPRCGGPRCGRGAWGMKGPGFEIEEGLFDEAFCGAEGDAGGGWFGEGHVGHLRGRKGKEGRKSCEEGGG